MVFDSRLKFMEDQMGTLQSTLTELVKMQRAIAGPSQTQMSQQPLPQHHPRGSESSSLSANVGDDHSDKAYRLHIRL